MSDHGASQNDITVKTTLFMNHTTVSTWHVIPLYGSKEQSAAKQITVCFLSFMLTSTEELRNCFGKHR